jgi:hypothetical protein
VGVEMKKIFSITSIFLLMFSSLNLFNTQDVLAKENNKKNTTFSVKAVHSEFQKEDNLPYFNFDGEPNKTYKLKVALKNFTKEKMSVAVTFKNGLSHPYGTIEYAEEQKTEFSNFVNKNYEFKKYIKGPQKIDLEPNQEKIVEFTVNIPENLNIGQLLGGLGFMDGKDVNMTNNDSKQKGVSLMSRLEYIVAVFIKLPQETKGKVIFKKAEIDTKTMYPKIKLFMVNEAPILLKDMDLRYKVFNKKDINTPIFEGKKKIERFSPSTDVIHLIDYGGEILETGQYYIEVEISGGNLSEKTFAKLDFEITEKEETEFAEAIGEKSKIPSLKPDNPLDFILLIAIGLILFGLGWFIPHLQRKRKEMKILEDLKKSQEDDIDLLDDEDDIELFDKEDEK